MKINKKTLKSWLYKIIVIAIVVAMILSVFVVVLR
jgi:hypothetical protein